METIQAAELPAKVRLSPDVVTQEFEGSLVLLLAGKGIYFELDDVGARMWRVLGATSEVAAALRQLCAEFAADEATIRGDLGRLVGELARAELLTVETA